jgi:hypothetical chaperone protein
MMVRSSATGWQPQRRQEAGSDGAVGIGIDFGTTNSAAAIFDGRAILLIQLEADSAIMPSATYIDRELQTLTGQAAIDAYIADNTGRTVEMVPEVIGTSSVMVGDSDPDSRAPLEMLTRKVYGLPLTDSGLQGRLFRGTKRLLGDPNVRRLMVFDHPFRLVALITPLLLHIRRRIEEAGVPAQAAHLGHPVHFEGRDPHRNKLALARLNEAYGHAGFQARHFYPEPVAATHSYLHANPEQTARHVLCVDFGGGTLDFSVLQRESERFRVLATHGLALGGDHIDQRLFRELLFPLLGKGERWRRAGVDRAVIETPFPFEDYEDLLLNWPVSYTLNQNRYTTAVMDCIDQGGPAAAKFRRLHELIKQNYSYVVFQAIRDLKAQLSETSTAVLDIPEIDVEIEVSREQFEVLIADLLERFEQGVLQTLHDAQLDADAIDLVVRTGGSSLIPAVRRILDRHFPSRVMEHDPFTSVAAGLALAAYDGYRYQA